MCQGNFCDYEFLERIKGVLQHRDLSYQGQGLLNPSQTLLGSILTEKQPFFILKKNIVHTLENWPETVKMLKRGLIVPGNFENAIRFNSIDALHEGDYYIKAEKSCKNPSDLYSKAKICLKCFQIYQFLGAERLIADKTNIRCGFFCIFK